MFEHRLRFVLLLVCLLILALLGGAPQALAQPLVAPSEALSPQEQLARFHLPPGFEIQLFAAEPAIAKPMNITFDSDGRLWVTDTLEYPYPARPGSVPRDSVKILADRDGDGTAENVSTFVDKLNIPLGVMPIPRGVLVYGIGSVWRCFDNDGDGRADTREELYTGFGSRDTHGMVNSFTRGLDGWLYACHGFNNDSKSQGSDGQAIAMNSGNTFRMRTDGSHLEYFTHGQVNPFGLAFDPLGNLYSADCHTMPIYLLLRGAYYPSFGKAHDGLDFGPTMIGHNHGSSGIGGIAYYAAEQFPPEYRDTIFIGNPVTGRVNHDRLKAHGSTYEAIEQPDFISCDDPWFRPVNIQVGPDGALYVSDFYNRIIGHYEVPLEHPGRDRHRGRIWRVVYTGKGVDQPAQTAPAQNVNVSQASPGELIGLLAHGNQTVRTLATHELVDRVGAPAIEPLRALLAAEKTSPAERVHAMWALERLDGLEPAAIDRLLADGDRTVRTQVLKLLAERKWEDVSRVRAALSDSDGFVRRAAADALGRHPRAENLKPLLDLWASTPADDTHLIHVVRMALRDQLLKDGMYAQVSQAVGSDAAQLDRLANVSLAIQSDAAAHFVWQLVQDRPGLPNRDALVHHAARHLPAEQLPAVYAYVLARTGLGQGDQIGLVRAVGRGTQERGAALPAEIVAKAHELTRVSLAAADEGQVRTGIELAREFHAAVFDALAAAAGQTAKFPNLRTAAMDACAGCDVEPATKLLGVILANAAEPASIRQHAAVALARINSDAARTQLLANLQTAPERLAVEIAAVLADSPAGAEGLLASIEAGKASPRLLQEAPVVTRLKARRLRGFEERLARLTASLPPQDARIRELLDRRRELVSSGKSDVVLGAAVFEKHCAICHRIGEKGAKVGPNLDGVGIRGLDRLLEDILDPNRNVDQAFRTTQVATSDGRIVSGLALREEGQVLVLADAQGKELRVPTSEIEERSVNQLSLMPSNVPDLVSEADFVHLLGYLLSQREASASATSQ